VKLRSIHLTNVRRFAGATATIDGIGGGVSVVGAPNEQGKSTFFEALQALFLAPCRSGSAEVRSLQPRCGGGPEVEVEVEVGGRRYRIAKRWLARPFARVTELPSGRLVAQDDAAEAWIGDLVAGPGAGPAGLLWVRQGLHALEPEGRGQAERSEQDKLMAARRGLLAVAEEIDAVTGGRRMDAIAERAAAELGALATATGRPRAGGPWRAAVDESERLRGALVELEAHCAGLRDALDARGEIERALAAASDPAADAARKEALTAARAAAQAARAQAARVEAARSELGRTEAELASAGAALAAHDRGAERLAAAEAELAEARCEDGACAAALTAADETEAGARVAAEAAERALATAREGVALAARAARARTAADRLAALEARLARAAALAAAADAAEAEAAAIRVGPEDLARATEAARDLDRALARRDAGAATIEVEYLPGAEGRILAAGCPLNSGVLRLAERTELALPGIGRLTFVPGRDAAAAAHDLAMAEQALAAALQRFGAADVGALETLARRRSEALDQARTARAELAGLVPDMQGLRAETDVARREAQDAPRQAPGAEQAAEAEAAASGMAEAAAAALAAAREAREAAARDAAVGRAGRETAERRRADAAAEAAGPEQREALAAAVAARSRATAAARERVVALAGDAADVGAAEAAMQDAERAASAAAELRHGLERRLAEVAALIRARADDGVEERRDEVAGLLEEAEARAGRCAAEVRALLRLRDALQAARSAARERYLAPVTRELAPLAARVFDQGELRMDPARLLPRALARDGVEEELGTLSGGTREQIAILTRLAFARLLARAGRLTPVILDDALVFADDERIARMFEALSAAAGDLQIIVLTCRQRAFAELQRQPGARSLTIRVTAPAPDRPELRPDDRPLEVQD
jgi:DNA repair exonuclease SbcCD ATPase subunit